MTNENKPPQPPIQKPPSIPLRESLEKPSFRPEPPAPKK